MTAPRSAFASALLLFACEAVITGSVYARLPDIKATGDLSNAAFGIVLIGVPIGNIAGFALAPFAVSRFGLTRVSYGAVAFLGIVSLGLGFATTAPAMMAAFAALGMCLSHTEVSQNSMAGHVERTSGRRVMSRCHGAWSVGSIVGLLLGGGLSQLAVPVVVQSAGAATVGIAASILLARVLPSVPRRAPAAKAARLSLRDRIPPTALMLLCLLPLGTLALEGIVRDWGAIFLRDDLGAEPFASTLLFVTVSTSMAVVRLLGDAILERLGERLVVGGSIVCASIGLLIVAAAPSLVVALIGAAVTGVGVAVVYPVALSIVARRSDAPERDIATMSFICFVTLMASPTAVGLLSEATGLRVTFAVFAVLSLIALLLLRVTGKAEQR